MSLIEWKSGKLGTFITLKRGYDLPLQNRKEGAIPIYSSAGLSGYHNEAKVKGPGVITGRIGTLGEVFYSEGDFWPHNNSLYVENFKGNFPRFILYLLKTIGIETNNDKSGVPGVNRNILHELLVKLPNVDTQQVIAKILSSLDDKIEVNRQTNQTLEAIAQVIFKEWFVDFNFPGATGEMQDGELGEIPKGWKVYKIGDLVESVSITHKFPKGKAIFLNTSDIEEGKVLHNHYSDKETLPGQAKKTIKKLDILFTEIRPANKRYALVDFDADDFVVSTKLMVLRAVTNVHPIVVYNFLTCDNTLKKLQHLAESRSGTFPQITFDQVKELKLALPEGELLKKYEKAAWSIFNQIKNNEEQTKTLTQLRDSLLPKLMKGEIPIQN